MLEQRAPGTIIHYADVFNGASSFQNLPKQHLAYTKEFLKLSEQYPDGINVVAFSQGGLIARCVLQSNQHNVHTPLNGQFGETDYLRKKYIKVNKFNLYKYLYRKRGQSLSIANYWRDPYHLDEYAAASEYLAVYNGETQ
ncbi:Oidioi.mRNA.OKI2018_I69.PAR.g11998.t1.cds [Oikopleura dioica]|uniref:Oidioi.mRNA.OKI2018_I69.PAR.g11998.t1.cds n=1 Tax=Oikopleura dioica TaxID=34765 RepID=A0ABN7S3U8_OIKDI|nr:Oidioi.mRNA.OKI2018_I69.PAR.g11998.t1.cds [Oikopleura dioica]